MFSVMNDNKALARRSYEEMWNQGKPAYAAEIFHRPGGVEKFVIGFLASFPDLVHSVEDMIAEEHQVAVRFSARGTHLGKWMDFQATGRVIQYTGVTWVRVANGKIAEHHTWWDKEGLIKQIGG